MLIPFMVVQPDEPANRNISTTKTREENMMRMEKSLTSSRNAGTLGVNTEESGAINLWVRIARFTFSL